jgi:tripartite-type tricarboxylate transporter receptor subunit TctC
MDDMTLPRRRFLRLAAGAAALPVAVRRASAQSYPERPVHIIVPFRAGYAPDILARMLGEWLSARLGRQFIVENRPGAGSAIGAEAVVNAPADGYTLLMVILSNALNATLSSNLKYDISRDLAAVACVANAPFLMLVNPEFPAKTVPEFIAYAKANPGRINMASGGNGTSTHVFGELFKMMTGVDMVHVPYRGSYMPDLLSGQVQVLFGPIPQTIEQVRAGKLRALGVTTARRLDFLPDIPAIGEFVPDYAAVGWYGVSAPKNTPAEIVDKLNASINAALADARVRERLVGLGVEPMPMRPAEFAAFIDRDIEKWAKVIKFAGIRPE